MLRQTRRGGSQLSTIRGPDDQELRLPAAGHGQGSDRRGSDAVGFDRVRGHLGHFRSSSGSPRLATLRRSVEPPRFSEASLNEAFDLRASLGGDRARPHRGDQRFGAAGQDDFALALAAVQQLLDQQDRPLVRRDQAAGRGAPGASPGRPPCPRPTTAPRPSSRPGPARCGRSASRQLAQHLVGGGVVGLPLVAVAAGDRGEEDAEPQLLGPQVLRQRSGRCRPWCRRRARTIPASCPGPARSSITPAPWMTPSIRPKRRCTSSRSRPNAVRSRTSTEK